MKIVDEKHLATVREFADARGLRTQFDDKLTWLGGLARDGAELIVYADHTPHSLYFELVKDGKCRLNGGVIYYARGDVGSDGPQFSTRFGDLDEGWEIHT